MLEKGIRELTADMRDGKVNTLVVIGGNPAFNAPADLNFKSELQKVATKIRLGLFHDQTSEACDWHLPLSHFLESWGDTETSDGTLCCVQPLIAPLNGAKTAGGSDIDAPPRGGRTALEVLALLTQFPNPDGWQAGQVVPHGLEGRVRRGSQGLRHALGHRQGRQELRHRVQPLQATRIPANPGSKDNRRERSEVAARSSK